MNSKNSLKRYCTVCKKPTDNDNPENLEYKGN